MPSDDPIILEPDRRVRPMGSDDPIILDPPDTVPAGSDDPIILEPDKVTTVKPQGLHNWRTVIKQYSTWALAVLLAAPDLYQTAATIGMLSDESMPAHLMWAIRGVAGAGLVLKFVKQQKPA